MKSQGTTPAGAATEEQAARWVRGMFGRVAPRYDLLNHVLSLNIDKLWRRHVIKSLRMFLQRDGATVVDLCCGTGDLTLGLTRHAKGRVFGCDFSHPMLIAAQRKPDMRPLFEADALSLPLRDESADVVTAAFGFRNLVNYRAGLTEIRRVLKPKGALAILEFSTPPNAAVRSVYGAYSRHVLPAIGGLVSGSRDAYTYLPESISKFPSAEELKAEMLELGYFPVLFDRMTFGIVALHLAIKR